VTAPAGGRGGRPATPASPGGLGGFFTRAFRIIAGLMEGSSQQIDAAMRGFVPAGFSNRARTSGLNLLLTAVPSAWAGRHTKA
jgi:hypothetical protein